VITGLRQLFQKNAMAVGVQRDEAQAAGTRVVLGPRAIFLGQAMGQADGCIVVGGHHRVFTVALALLLSPRGGRPKAVKACQIEEETDQAHAAGPNCDADEMAGNHDAVEEAIRKLLHTVVATSRYILAVMKNRTTTWGKLV
jgi:hypothetical protein